MIYYYGIQLYMVLPDLDWLRNHGDPVHRWGVTNVLVLAFLGLGCPIAGLLLWLLRGAAPTPTSACCWGCWNDVLRTQQGARAPMNHHGTRTGCACTGCGTNESPWPVRRVCVLDCSGCGRCASFPERQRRRRAMMIMMMMMMLNTFTFKRE